MQDRMDDMTVGVNRLRDAIDGFTELDFVPDGRPWTQHLAEHLIECGAVMPPCKVGDKMYEVIDAGREGFIVSDNTVTEIGTKTIFFSGTVPPGDDLGFEVPMDDFGKTLFRTLAEAEKVADKLNKERK